MYNGLKHAHSGLRWIFLLFLIYAIFNAYTKWKSGKEFLDGDRKANLFTFILANVQFVLGLALYLLNDANKVNFDNMSNSVNRFYSVEHITIMIIGIALISIGYSKAKRTLNSTQKFKSTFIFYAIGLLLILAGIPWPFRIAGAGWF